MPIQTVPSYNTQSLHLGVETTYGTYVDPLKAILSGRMPLQANIETESFMPSGYTTPTIMVVNDDFVTAEYTGKPDYNAIGYILQSFFGAPVTASLGGSPEAFQHTFTYDASEELVPESYTVAYGKGALGRYSTGFVFDRYGFSISRGGVDFTSGGFGKAIETGFTMYPRSGIVTVTITGAPDGGTFTITVNGQTTAGIAYNAIAGAVQTALEALSNVAPGDVTVTGGPGPATPYVLTFAGALANTVMTVTASGASLTGGATPAATATDTLTGGDITEVVPVIMFPLQFGVFMESSFANLASPSTRLLYVYDFGIDTAERLSRTRPINEALTSDGVVETEDATHTVSMTLGADATADALVDDLRAGDTVYVALRALGATISGANKYQMLHKTAVKVTSADAYQSSESVHVIPLTGTIVQDDTADKAIEVVLVNTHESYEE